MIEQRYYVSIEESLQRLLSTPLGARVMRPTYGSRLFELIDRRFDEEWKIDAARFVFEAVSLWERRIEIQKIVPQIQEGRVVIEIFYVEQFGERGGVFTYAA